MNEQEPKGAEVPLEVFRQVVEQAALAISITDPDAHILYSNQTFQRVTGYKTEEAAGRNESILSYKVTPKHVYETMWANLIRKRPWNGVLVNRRKNGQRYLAELTITPVLDATGRTTHYLGMHRDVTEMHRLERQVQNQKTLIESVVDAAPVAMVMLDDEEKVILDNQEYKKLIGAVGHEPALVMLDALRADLGGEFERAQKSGRSLTGREIRYTPDGDEARWFTCSVSWIDEQDASADGFYQPVRRRYMLLVIQDITAQKKQQEAIQVAALRNGLAKQERIQALREVLSGALFQLQGPFNVLAAAVRMLELQNGSAPAQPLIDSLQDALAQGNQALDTLRACIPCQEQETATLVELNTVLKDLLRLFTPNLLAEGITVEWLPEKDLPAIQGRPTRLTSLFKALLENALDAIREGRGGRRELRLSSHTYPDRVEVRIEDSGPGIPAEWRYKAFEPFFTTKGAERQHIGMGLITAQEIVAEHGGLIELDDAPGGGCLARVQLPVAQP